MADARHDTRTRQRQIARAALRIVAERGLGGLNIAAVAERVGVVPSAIYRHFSGRSDVITAALGLVESELRENVRRVQDEAASPLARVERLLERHVRLILDNPGIPRLVFSEEVAAAPERRRAVYGAIAAYLDDVAGLFRDARNAGEIRDTAAPETAALLFLGILQPAAVLWQMSDGALDLEEHARSGWEVLRAGLAARP